MSQKDTRANLLFLRPSEAILPRWRADKADDVKEATDRRSNSRKNGGSIFLNSTDMRRGRGSQMRNPGIAKKNAALGMTRLN